ncbi:hypothetical protein RUM43_007392 [Polyplax serrata]|uniref:Uncharacterized protein n=1 Tax=Polyplax serrata TaxID=468196 RepID=A0AAN8S7U1_POLSC
MDFFRGLSNAQIQEDLARDVRYSSRDTLSPNGSLTDSPVPLKVCGPLTLFSFVLPAKHEKVSYSEQKQYLKSAIEESTQFHGGLLLVTKEKGGKQEK